MKLSAIKENYPHMVNIQVVEHETLRLSTISHFTDMYAVMDDSSKIDINAGEYEIVSIKSATHFKRHANKKKFCEIVVVEFSGENLSKFESGEWPLSYRDEMIADQDLQQMMSLSVMGVIEVMHYVLSQKTTNGTWLTQERKEYYLSKISQGIALYG